MVVQLNVAGKGFGNIIIIHEKHIVITKLINGNWLSGYLTKWKNMVGAS
jgi:hypothetical protein